jgi:hypothetical protein
VVEVRDGIVQSRRRQVDEQSLESSKRLGRLKRLISGLDGIIRPRAALMLVAAA